MANVRLKQGPELPVLVLRSQVMAVCDLRRIQPLQKFTRARCGGWLTPVIPALWEAKAGRSQGQEFETSHHGETPSLLRIQKLSGITDACYHSWLIFVFLVESEFHHVGQAGLDLLTSSHPPTSASQSAGITGVSHCPTQSRYS
uniref:Uncharacterized protein n=1 Tax=Macaca mulatta TaxID=9544 RepID=A0A5F7ZF14_MACMU